MDLISTNDSATDRQLRLVVGLVVVSASAVLVGVGHAVSGQRTPLSGTAFVLATALIAAGSAAVLYVRYRSTREGISAMSAALLFAIGILPAPWPILATTLAVFALKLPSRQPLIKTGFNVAKDTLVAAAATGAALAVGLHPGSSDFAALAPRLAVAAICLAAVDAGLTAPVLALASRTPVRERLTAQWQLRVIAPAGNYLVAMASLAVWQLDHLLIVALPVLILASQLTYANRLRARTEREAWQKLAQATDELNEVDLDVVLRAGVTRAAQLFSADEVDIEIRQGNVPPRLVRGTSERVTFDGSPGEAPLRSGRLITTALESQDGQADIGELRLRFRGEVNLTDRERYTMRTFAAALCTALRNAATFAETQRLAEQHAHAAAHDALTGLANRRRLQDYAAEVLDERGDAGSVALVLIDLNHFKEINDTLGHSAGDRVLIEIARRLADRAAPDDMVARLGGDEFAVLFTRLPAPALAVPRARNILASLDEPVVLDDMRIVVEASAGVAGAPARGGVAELLRRADVAMYQAKREGQAIAVYARARDTADVGRLALGGDLPRAVAKSEFVVNFQPIVDLTSGEVIAAEALARWLHPDRGSLNPQRFLDSVERSGLLPAFAEGVLDQALRAAAAWRDSGFDLPVAVNVSPRSLLDPSYPDVVAERLAARGVSADRLVIELTESLTLSQLDVVDHVLRALRDLGVRLALDDFGTGYSSLATLARVQVHELKIDRAFVAGMGSPTEEAVVRSTIELGRSLGLVVVAEGVESEQQRRALWELGCPAGQGHLFGRPMPAHRLVATLRRGCGGRPGVLATPLHESGSVIRLPTARRGRTGERRDETG
ncbi:MAG TPA: bifunctional diguanylate cyclase/phosphodiesterase [Micromonosporaceae bacterium]